MASDRLSSASRAPVARQGAEGWRVLREVVVLAVAVRVVLLVVGVAATGGTAPIAQRALGMWSRWDAPHFLRVAEIGYATTGEDALFIVFLPGYPALVAGLSLVLRSEIVAGLVVSFAAAVGAGWLLNRLVALDHDRATARRSVVLLFSFPTAYFLAAPYSESLFLVAVLGAVYSARTVRWPAAGVAAAVATATRLQAIPLLPALVAASLSDRTEPRRHVGRLAWVGLGVAGIVAYLAINLTVHGDPLHFVGVQRSHWNNEAAPPWQPLAEAVSAVRGGVEGDLAVIHWGRLAATVFVVVVLAAGTRRLPVADHLYAWTSLLLILSSSWLISMPRYILGIYPIFVVLALATRSRARLWVVAGACFVLQCWLFARYATGRWTF